jgi:aerobic carbon-monoxide dehydrogenase medium subunit
MLALSADILVSGPKARRKIAAKEFFTGLFATALAPDEILTGVEFAAAQAEDRFSFDELARRSGDYALAGLACAGRLRGDRFSTLNLAFFAVGDRPVLAAGAASKLVGRPITAAALAEAQAVLADDLDPHADRQASAAMRLHLSRVLLARAARAMTAAGSGQSS